MIMLPGQLVPEPHPPTTTTNSKMDIVVENLELTDSSTKNIMLRHLSLPQLLLLNAIVCGLEFCASAAFTYIPPMLLKAGIAEKYMSIILGVGPLLGFFIVPVIGRASDACKSPYGRRRPYIFVLSLLLISSLIIIPYGELFGIYAFGAGTVSKQMGVLLLIAGSVMLDFTSQACLTPCEALLSDACKNTNQQDRCFTVYSFMVSLGGCIGYLITALDWSSSSVGLYFGGQEQSAFSLLILLFTFAMCATLGVAEENPVDPLPQSDSSPTSDTPTQITKRLDQIHQAIVRQKDAFQLLGIAGPDAGYESGSNQSLNDEYQSLASSNDAELVNRKKDFKCEKICSNHQWTIPLTRWSFLTCDGLLHVIALKCYSLLPETMKSLLTVPFVLRRLAMANFCSWTAVMGFNLFYTDFIGQAVYGGNPNAPENSMERDLYDAGVRMGSWGLLFHCVTSAIYAPFIERLVARYGMQKTYFMGMMSFTLAMMLMVFIRSIVFINLMASCTGFAFATVTTIPFMLVTSYHGDKEVFFFDVRHSSSSPVANRGIGSDMATLDSAYFLSQVVLSACMGYIVHYTGTVLSYVIISGAVGAVACACVPRIIFTKQQILLYVKSAKFQNNSSCMHVDT